jgi:hypothetical protein
MTKLNVFIKHGPTGVEGHIELDGEMTKEDYDRFLKNVTHTFSWLAENEFEPSKQVHNGTPKASPASDVPACPDCGGDMYDNRPQKATGEFKANSPDFKCKNKDCNKAIWPKRKAE